MTLLQRPFATVALYPAAPHSVQHVCGNSLFRARRHLMAKRGHILPEGPMATSALCTASGVPSTRVRMRLQGENRTTRVPGPRCPVSSIKGEVKKKHFSAGWKFSCFAAHIIEQDLY